MSARKSLPPNCRPGRRITVTLTVGQMKVIEQSAIFGLCGNSYSEVLKHWIMEWSNTETLAAQKREWARQLTKLLDGA